MLQKCKAQTATTLDTNQWEKELTEKPQVSFAVFVCYLLGPISQNILIVLPYLLPDVIITLLKRLKIGAIAREESRQQSCKHGSEAPGILDSFGSMIMANLATPSE